MRKQHTQRTSTAAPVHRAKSGLPTSGYALVVDGQIRSEFNTQDRALKAARDLKSRGGWAALPPARPAKPLPRRPSRR